MMHTADLLFDCLRRMDNRADTLRDGHPTGLNWYGPHARPEQKRPQTEPCWSLSLKKILSEAGYPTRTEVSYPRAQPGSRARCDLVVTSPSDGRLWIEIKGAWKEYWIKKGKERIYRSYLLHPLVQGLEDKKHTVPRDIEKLALLRKSEADRVAILLIGFDTCHDPMDADVDELVRLAVLGSATWRGASTTWDDPYRHGCRVRCWYWSRAVE